MSESELPKREPGKSFDDNPLPDTREPEKK